MILIICYDTYNHTKYSKMRIRIPPAPPTKTPSHCGKEFYVGRVEENPRAHVANEPNVSTVCCPAKPEMREFVSAKRAASALQARAATIERTGSNPSAASIGAAPHCGDRLFRLTSPSTKLLLPAVVDGSPRSAGKL